MRLRSDEQLVGLFRSGSEEAFSVIHDRYRQRLSVYARQMLGGSGNDADDVLQDVFLRAYRALRADARPVSLRAWLYRVAHNRCIDHLRRPAPPAEEIYEVSRTPIADTTLVAERREDLARLVRDVQRLPEQQRSALLMREMDGMSYADLASALDTSVPAVKSLLVRARIGLVEAIEARDADCADIRHDLAASYDRGVRASGHARRHMRECSGCATFRTQLREVRQGFAALSPGPVGPALLAKLLGLGGAGAGGAAGGTAAVGGTTAAVGVGKVAAVVCCAAAITGGAVEVPRIVAPAREAPAVAAPPPTAEPARAQTAVAAALVRGSAPGAGLHVAPAPERLRAAAVAPAAGAEDLALHPDIPMTMSPDAEARNPHGPGGAAAPAEETGTAAPTAQPMDEGDQGLTGVAVGVLTPADEEPAASGGQDKPASGSSSSSSGSGTSSGSQSGTGTAGGSSSAGTSTSSSSGTAQSSSASGSSSTASSGTSSG